MVPDAGIHAHCGTLSFAAAFARQVSDFHGAAAIEQRLAKLPDRARAARQRMLFDQGIAAPIVPESAKAHDKMLGDIETALVAGPWLAGQAYSLAECAILPYILRLEKLGLAAMWAGRPKLADWYARAKARPSWQSAIVAFPSSGEPDYDDDLVARKVDVWPPVKAMLAA
jgi:glutathione S-transferase